MTQQTSSDRFVAALVAVAAAACSGSQPAPTAGQRQAAGQRA